MLASVFRFDTPENLHTEVSGIQSALFDLPLARLHKQVLLGFHFFSLISDQ